MQSTTILRHHPETHSVLYYKDHYKDHIKMIQLKCVYISKMGTVQRKIFQT